MVFFGFVYEIILANPQRVNNFVIPQHIVSPFKVNQGTNGASPDGVVLKNKDYLDYNTIPPEAWSIKGENGKGLQVKFNINQAKENGVPCSLEIYNLDDEIITKLRKDSLIIIRAGYRQTTGDYIDPTIEVGQDSLPDLFVGQIASIATRFTEVDVVTSILCGEALTVQKNSRVAKTFSPNTTRLNVIRGLLSLLNEQGIPTGRFIQPPAGTKEYQKLNSPYLSGYSCQGYLMAELEKVCSACDLKVFQSVGKVYIEPSRLTRTSNLPLKPITVNVASPVVVIRPENIKGRISISDAEVSNQPTNADDKKANNSLSLTTYLNPDITIDKIVSLEGFNEIEGYSGEYTISSLSIVGDYREAGVWETHLMLTSISQ